MKIIKEIKIVNIEIFDEIKGIKYIFSDEKENFNALLSFSRQEPTSVIMKYTFEDGKTMTRYILQSKWHKILKLCESEGE